MLSVRDIAFNETGVRAVFPAAAQACHELYWQTVFALRGLSGRIHRPQSFAHAYAVCVVADGGEEGLDTLLASLAGQSIGFVEHIRVVVSGPEAPLAKVWKDRYPTNVILLPETEDRNAALRACLELKGIAWMAFARSGESFHRDCFRSLDRFIHSPAGKGVVLAVGATALQRGGRLTFRRMRGTPRSMPLHALAEEISGDAAFFSVEAIRQSGATFEANCGCLMELFSGAFLLGQDNSANVGFVPGALRLCPEHNGLPCRPETLHRACCSLLGNMPGGGPTPPWLEQMLLSMAAETATFFAYSSDATPEGYIPCLAMLRDVLPRIGTDRILERRGLPDPQYFKPLLLALGGGDMPCGIFNVLEYDPARREVLLRSFGRGEKSVLASARPDLLRAHKRLARTFCGTDALFEFHEWFSVAAPLRQANTYFLIGRRILDSVSAEGLDVFFSNRLSWLPGCGTDGSWVLLDRDTQADDNAEHLYRWLQQHHPEQKSFFALRRTSHDWVRLKREGFHLLDIASPAYVLQRLRASVVVSSHADDYTFEPVSIGTSGRGAKIAWILNKLFTFLKKDCRHVFLQHGVSKDNASAWLNTQPISLFITTTSSEHALIAGTAYGYRYTEKTVKLTGFPRHDALSPHVGSRPALPRLLVAPTWRSWLAGSPLHSNMRAMNPDFMASRYARTWQAFLSGEGLRRLREKFGFDIVFFPHANVQPYLSQISLPEWVRAASHRDTRFQELLLSSSLLVTDYSSLAFEMAFLNRPVVYYQFDAEEFYAGRHVYVRSDYDYVRDGFGPVAETEEAILQAVAGSAANGFMTQEPWRGRMEKTFPYRDGRNCERVYDAIMDMMLPRSKEEA